jgi:transcriptional regulator with XRE-family HTH domain
LRKIGVVAAALNALLGSDSGKPRRVVKAEASATIQAYCLLAMDTDQRPLTLRRPRRRAGEALAPEAIMAQRLNRLFSTVYPPGRGPYTAAELLRAVNARGVKLSAPYLSQLRTGERIDPSPKIIEAIAGFFGIHPYYFTSSDHAYIRYLDAELDWLALARSPDLQRVITALLQVPHDVREDIIAAVR